MSPTRKSACFAIEALYPSIHLDLGVSYSVRAVTENIADEQIRAGATVMAMARNVRGSYVHPIMHRYVYSKLAKCIKDPMHWVFLSARRRLRAGDVAYFWCDGPPRMSTYFRARKIMVVREMINCTMKLKREELRRAYAALGEPDRSGITDEMIARERAELLAADAIFCPNPFVKSSVVEYGIPAERCIETSYGWSADRMVVRPGVVPEASIFTVAFVGTIDVRKGAPLLLDAWVKSKINGRLLLAGNMSAEVKERYARILDRPDIVQLGFVRDVGSVYGAADVFCFPTWEEGGPQVTFEAMSMGAVPIVTPMGTGGAFNARDDVGIVIQPGDVGALTEALCSLAADRDRLNLLKQRTKAHALNYEWKVVGRHRRDALIEHRNAWLAANEA